MKKRKLVKRRAAILCIILLAILAIILTIILFTFPKKDKVTFYINDKETSQLSKTVEYTDDIDYSAKAIKLTAKKGDKDISKQIKADKVKINKLKTYKINYQVDGNTFVYELKVIDKTAPIINGESTMTIKVNETFDQASLKLSATDNFDKDITDKITSEGEVDTATPGEYELIFKVSDSSKNTSEFKVKVIVEKEEEAPADNNNQSNGNSGSANNTGSNVINNPNDITVMINKQNKLPDGWAPSDLVSIGGSHYLRAEAAASLNQMRQAAQNSGIPFNVVSSYRTQAYQANLYNNYYASDPVNAPYYSALPRTSEHELGLAVDISYDYALHDDLQNSSLGQWMAAHAHEFGWIMRYPYGKSDYTGYIFEAWHYRYVGVSLATQLRNSNLTMEEYY